MKAGLAISGVYDLAPIRDTALDVALKLSHREIAELSPLRLKIVQKPLAIAYGSAELPAWCGTRGISVPRGKRPARPGDPHAIEGADHFTILEQFSRPDGALTKLALSLVRDS
jgi:hypothetical protein